MANYSTRAFPDGRMRGRTRLLGSTYNKTPVKFTSLLSANVTPITSPAWIRASIIASATAYTTSLYRTGLVTTSATLMHATGYLCGCQQLCVFEFPVLSGESINFSINKGGGGLKVRMLTVEELIQ